MNRPDTIPEPIDDLPESDYDRECRLGQQYQRERQRMLARSGGDFDLADEEPFAEWATKRGVDVSGEELD